MSSSPQVTEGLIEGTVLGGKYRVERLLGAGGMCFVYEAEHIHLKQSIALKVLKPDFAKDTTAVARFAQEAQSAAGLRSPNVARVYDVDRLADGQPFITMELLVGNDLGTELQRRYSLPMDQAVDYVRQAAQGIAEAHAMGIVHRDLKPENLYLTELGEMTERKLLKILDFGIAKNIADTARKLTAPDAVFGTVDYMSPEQIRSASTVDHRTDIWSLGVILFELLTGRTPYVGDARSVIAQIVSDPIVPPSRYVPTLPPELVAVVMKALAKDREERYQSAQELRHALTPFCHGAESITGLLARIPPTTIPRRKSSVDPVSAIRMMGDNPSGRDVRGTNLSFETTSTAKTWTKNVTVPAVGIMMLLAMGILIKVVRSAERRSTQANQLSVTAVEAPPVVMTSIPIPVVMTAAPTYTPPVVTINPLPPDPTTVSPTTSPTASPPTPARAPAKAKRSAAPHPAAPTPAPAATPSPPPPSTSNPKIL